MKLVVMNGMPRSGKTTIEQIALKKLGVYGKIASTIDFVKEIATRCGWDGTKTPENRKFLSDMKDLLTKWNDVPFQKIKESMDLWQAEFDDYDIPVDGAILFVDSREPAEIDRFKKELGAITVLVRRPSVENQEQSNHADSDVFNYKYDIEFVNNGTLEELDHQVDKFLEYINEK